MHHPSELPGHLLNQPFTLAEARSAGLSRRRTRAGDLTSPCHGVRIAAAAEDSLLERVRAVAAVTGAVASHTSAAVLWGFPLPAALERLYVIHMTSLPGRRAVRRRNIVGHQQTLAPEEIVAGRLVVCTSLLRTWFDLAGILSLDELVIAGDFLFRRRNPLSTPARLDAYLAGKQGRPGYRRAMQARSLMRAGTDSPKETELRLLLLRHGLPEPGINVPMFDETGGWIQDPDMSYEREKARDPVRRRTPRDAGPATQRHLPGRKRQGRRVEGGRADPVGSDPVRAGDGTQRRNQGAGCIDGARLESRPASSSGHHVELTQRAAKRRAIAALCGESWRVPACLAALSGPLWRIAEAGGGEGGGAVAVYSPE